MSKFKIILGFSLLTLCLCSVLEANAKASLCNAKNNISSDTYYQLAAEHDADNSTEMNDEEAVPNEQESQSEEKATDDSQVNENGDSDNPDQDNNEDEI